MVVVRKKRWGGGKAVLQKLALRQRKKEKQRLTITVPLAVDGGCGIIFERHSQKKIYSKETFDQIQKLHRVAVIFEGKGSHSGVRR